jgi:hypothetical protein
VNPNQTHTLRRNEVVAEIRKQLPASVGVNFYDVYVIRKTHNIEDNQKYYFQPRFGSAQYSIEFVNWILDRYKENNNFFTKTRSEFKRNK